MLGVWCSVTAEFRPIAKAANPDGDLFKIVLKPRLRTPDEPVEINLQLVDGQLSLYEQDAHTEAVRDEVDNPDPKGNGHKPPASAVTEEQPEDHAGSAAPSSD